MQENTTFGCKATEKQENRYNWQVTRECRQPIYNKEIETAVNLSKVVVEMFQFGAILYLERYMLDVGSIFTGDISLCSILDIILRVKIVYFVHKLRLS